MTDDDLKRIAREVWDVLNAAGDVDGDLVALEAALTRVRDASVREARAQAFEEGAGLPMALATGKDEDRAYVAGWFRAVTEMRMALGSLAAREREGGP